MPNAGTGSPIKLQGSDQLDAGAKDMENNCDGDVDAIVRISVVWQTMNNELLQAKANKSSPS